MPPGPIVESDEGFLYTELQGLLYIFLKSDFGVVSRQCLRRTCERHWTTNLLVHKTTSGS